MKDVSVIVELAVDDDMSDEAIQVLVETALRNTHFANMTSFEVDNDVIDVVAITDGILDDPTPPEWRRMPHTR